MSAEMFDFMAHYQISVSFTPSRHRALAVERSCSTDGRVVQHGRIYLKPSTTDDIFLNSTLAV
jgi:hypothetical protein